MLLPYQVFIQERLSRPISQKFPVLVRRTHNSDVIVDGYGVTPDDAAESIRRHVREYGCYDNVSVESAPGESAPDRGAGR